MSVLVVGGNFKRNQYNTGNGKKTELLEFIREISIELSPSSSHSMCTRKRAQ